MEESCTIIESGSTSRKIYFIFSGQVNLMDKAGIIEYANLQEGSYFGDISSLLNEPAEYSYMYDPFLVERPLQLLAIDTHLFR